MSMDEQTQGTATATETTPSQSEGTSVPSTGEAGGAEATAGETPDGAQALAGLTPPASPYTPNPTFKVKNLEKKFDDWILGSIKDSDTEKKARELYEKAHGIDFVKQERQSFKEEARTLKGQMDELKPVLNHFSNLSSMVQKKDFDSFFSAAQIPKQEILQWALSYAQMSPEARMARDQAAQMGLQNMQLQTQHLSAQEQHAQQAAQYYERELDWSMERPDVSRVVQALDMRKGPGTFRDQVIRCGQFHASQGRMISVADAVKEVINLVGFVADTPNAGQAAPQSQVANPMAAPQAQMPQQATPASIQAQTAKPVIPNIQGSGTSPAKKVPQSLDDIRRMAKEMAGRAG